MTIDRKAEVIEHDDEVPLDLMIIVSETKETLLSVLDCLDLLNDDEADSYKDAFEALSHPFAAMGHELYRRAQGKPALH